MTTTHIEELELRALEQRQHLHHIAEELKAKVESTRQNLSIENNTRKYFGTVALVASSAALLAGYLFTGMFTGRSEGY